jgi:hypothetical protein
MYRALPFPACIPRSENPQEVNVIIIIIIIIITATRVKLLPGKLREWDCLSILYWIHNDNGFVWSVQKRKVAQSSWAVENTNFYTEWHTTYCTLIQNILCIPVKHVVTVRACFNRHPAFCPRNTYIDIRYNFNYINLYIYNKTKLNSVAWVRKRSIPTEWPALVGEVSPNFCG